MFLTPKRWNYGHSYFAEGAMKYLTLACACGLLAISVSAAPKWHRATKKECDAEYRRELKIMNANRIYGDPPISLGNFEGNGVEWWSYEPCGYADDSKPPNFRPRYTHSDGKKRTEISKKEWEKRDAKFD